MKLIYRCSNCAAQNEFTVPASIALYNGAADLLAGKVEGFALHMWIRHECAQDLHGIAPLVAIVGD